MFIYFIKLYVLIGLLFDKLELIILIVKKWYDIYVFMCFFGDLRNILFWRILLIKD